jgi:hypothetical protein
MQTDNQTIDNKCVLFYKTLLTQFSRQSPSPTPETVMTIAPSAARPTFQGSNLSDSSDEEDPYVEIKKTRPNPPVYTHRPVNLEEDLALSSDSSDEELDQAARDIEKELF